MEKQQEKEARKIKRKSDLEKKKMERDEIKRKKALEKNAMAKIAQKKLRFSTTSSDSSACVTSGESEYSEEGEKVTEEGNQWKPPSRIVLR